LKRIKCLLNRGNGGLKAKKGKKQESMVVWVTRKRGKKCSINSSGVENMGNHREIFQGG